MIQMMKRMKARLMQATVVVAVGGALVWVWWRRHLEGLWRRPQAAPLSAQWLYPSWPHA